MKIVIGAAAGNIGRRVAEQVLKAGAETVLLVRQPGKVSDLAAAGAEVRVADMDDARAVVEASRGADALFWLIPPNLGAADLREWHLRVARAGVAAVRENRIPRAVLVTSMGAGAGPDLGTVSLVAELEALFREAVENVMCLRPGYFLENLLDQAELLRREGAMSFTYPADHDLPWISTDDIGDAAARSLLDASWTGHQARELMGPENLTPVEVAARISREWGHPVKYVQVPVESAVQFLASKGATPDVQQQLAGLFRALGDPRGVYAAARTPEAFTPTTLERFTRAKLLPLLKAGMGPAANAG
jgi:uncharacterized protein YbjT (DUF2867 family)